MTIDMSQFYEAFFEEADELLAQTEQLLLKINVENPSQETLDAIFRVAHSIKGGAATFGFTHTTEITHALENLLDKILAREISINQNHIDILLQSKDVIADQLSAYRNGIEPNLELMKTIKSRLETLYNTTDKSVNATTTETQVKSSSAQQSTHVEMIDQSGNSATEDHPASPKPVDNENPDRWTNLINQLSITQSVIEQQVNELDTSKNAELLTSIDQLKKISRDLQETFISDRINSTENKFPYIQKSTKEISPIVNDKNDMHTECIAIEQDEHITDHSDGPFTFLTCVLDQQSYGIDILKVQEIRGYDSVTKIARMPDFVKGVINLRGHIIPIVDLKIKFNQPSSESEGQQVLIILNFGERMIGIVVDGVSDVVTIESENIRPVPKISMNLDTKHITGLCEIEDKMMILIDIEKLMNGDEMVLIDNVARGE